MSYRPCLLSLMLLFAASSASLADVFERDWKVPGDGLLTYDDVNEREWLDLTETLLIDFASTDCIYGCLDNVLEELGPGGLFEGFIFADAADTFAFAESAGVDTTTLDYAVNGVATNALIDLIGPTVMTSAGSSSLGLVDTPNDPVARFYVIPIPHLRLAGLDFVPFGDLGNDRPTFITGVMLFRPVPEPSSNTFIAFTFTFTLLLSRRSPRALSHAFP